ncbi:pilin [Actinocatenispora comari]|uniref:Uncharacterized protein n=1 Tax=Actinocatenispora comari TaxID=2807577 RepID=A0A8J4ELB0_9ACTN|nr:pilin [Actinocatenispora comari]GIL29092.1 hypothetical protein NUM_43460 [Actinocatenispora comari]
MLATAALTELSQLLSTLADLYGALAAHTAAGHTVLALTSPSGPGLAPPAAPPVPDLHVPLLHVSGWPLGQLDLSANHSLAGEWLADKAKKPHSLPTIISKLRLWIMGLLAGVATLFLVVGGVRYLAAGGDPSEVERAKSSLKSALIGYALAVLAPVLLTVLQSIIGG